MVKTSNKKKGDKANSKKPKSKSNKKPIKIKKSSSNSSVANKKKRNIDKNIKKYTPEDAIDNSLEKIRRLENIHIARKNEEMMSDKIAFWLFLIISVITNFSLSFILIFLIVFLQDPLVYIIVAIIGFAFGLVYSYMIHGLRYSLFHHHAFAKIFILLTGSINVFYIISTSTIILKFIGLSNSVYNQIGISIVYFISYLIPYFLEMWIRKILEQ